MKKLLALSVILASSTAYGCHMDFYQKSSPASRATTPCVLEDHYSSNFPGGPCGRGTSVFTQKTPSLKQASKPTPISQEELENLFLQLLEAKQRDEK